MPVATEPHLVTLRARRARGAARRTACATGRARLARLLEEVRGRRRRAGDPRLGAAAAGDGRTSSAPGAPISAAAPASSSPRSRAPALRDALEQSTGRFAGLFVVRPAHNPLGPLDFDGVYDERSDRIAHARRARRPRLRGRLPPVHRAGRRRPSGERIERSPIAELARRAAVAHLRRRYESTADDYHETSHRAHPRRRRRQPTSRSR